MRKSAATRAAEIKQISLLIADDASIIRRALRRMLQDMSELSIVGDCRVEELISQARKFQPDVALIDVVDPTLQHVELTKSLHELAKSVEVIIMSQYKHPDIIRAFFEVGGGGCLATEATNETLLAAIRRVAAGRKYIDPNVSDEVAVALVGDGARPRAVLSRREKEVLRFLASGFSYKETGQKLGISAASVETYRQRMIAKLDLRGRAELIRYALLSGIVGLGEEDRARVTNSAKTYP